MTPQSGPEDQFKSLLSLSSVAANAIPIPVAKTEPPSDAFSDIGGSYGTRAHHRRLSSIGKNKRRLSDARDAASRPSPASLSLSSLSLSSASPPVSTSVTSTASSIMDSAELAGIAKPVIIPKNGKKRGMDHKCESCSKIYRHPSCLIKHRWEHTPHWRESSKYVLSKHQQVQLLEAAAILSHLSPTSSSLPDDRSLWPSFLSGGSLPKQDNPSASVPTGPRMHDYHLPATSAATQVRPGLLAVPMREPSEPVFESDEDEEMYDDMEYRGGGFGARGLTRVKKEEEEEWDDLDMDME